MFSTNTHARSVSSLLSLLQPLKAGRLFLLISLTAAVWLTAPGGKFLTPTQAATLCVNPGGTGGCFATIQAAVNAADATPETDVINVAAGTYAALVTIPASEPGLVINGANANINACTGTRVAESIVGAATGAFQISANNVTINGFTIQGVTGGLGGGIHAASITGAQILNNIVQNNVIGIAIDGSSVLIQGNNIRNNTVAGPASGNGIYSDSGLTNSTIDGNCFSGHFNSASNLIGAPVVGAAVNNVTVTNNTATNEAPFTFYGGTNLIVTNNRSVSPTSQGLYFGGGVNGATVTGNTLSNGASAGIRVLAEFGGANSNITANCNRIVGFTNAAINVEAGGYTGTLNAENNFYGCNGGPGSAGCSVVVAPNNNVDFNPWLVLSLAANPNPIFTGQTATLTASLNTNSAGANTTCGVAGAPVTFSSTCGTVNPASANTVGGNATSTLTAGAAAGSCTSSATVDNQTVTVNQQINQPPSPVGPGLSFPATAEVSGQKAGSVLVYNLVASSGAAPHLQNTRISLTNTNPNTPVGVHLFFVEGATCSVADVSICLTQNQTISFLASDFDPGTTGYIIAVATSITTGCPINFNFLIGDERVKLSSGHAASLATEAIAALAGGLTACNDTSFSAQLNFDGVSYNRLPRTLAASNIPSRADGNDTLLVVNRIGGNLASGAATLGTLFGTLYNDAEQGFSFSLSGNCQLRGSFGADQFPRTTPPVSAIIPIGRSGWFKVSSQAPSDIAILGALINFNPAAGAQINAFNQGHNLHKLTLTTTGVLTIPIFPPSC